ncbi:MAG: hypothetical protein GKS05_05900 [Nitrospirales bacterium]|nr:hypothetical protein [Nitrospirales bacterium]
MAQPAVVDIHLSWKNHVLCLPGLNVGEAWVGEDAMLVRESCGYGLDMTRAIVLAENGPTTVYTHHSLC